MCAQAATCMCMDACTARSHVCGCVYRLGIYKCTGCVQIGHMFVYGCEQVAYSDTDAHMCMTGRERQKGKHKRDVQAGNPLE